MGIYGSRCTAFINNNISQSPNITHMKYLAVCTLILACVLYAGCTGTQAPAATPAPTTVPATTTAATPTPQPSFSLGDHYLEDPGGYQLLTEKDTVVKEFRVDSDSWGIYFKIRPLNDNLQYCWFTMDVTNMDTGRKETFGYGRDQSYETERWIPMYKQGPYRLTLTGNNVKAYVTAAKRNP
jgi:hypothetical protein